MKKITFTIFLIINFIVAKAQSHYAQVKGYGEFLAFVRKNFKPSKEVKQNCEWQYALVQATIKKNRVISLEVLSNGDPSLLKSFNFLKKYTFSHQTRLINRHLVFCVTIENQKNDCVLKRKQYTPSVSIGVVMAGLSSFFKKDPQLIFLPEPIDVSYSFDPER